MVRRVRPLEVCKAASECLSATGHKWDSGSDAWRGPQEGAAQAAALAAAIAPKQNLSVCKTVKVGPWHLGARIRTISAGVSGRGGRRYGRGGAARFRRGSGPLLGTAHRRDRSTVASGPGQSGPRSVRAAGETLRSRLWLSTEHTKR